jgi:hypothetical protein
MALLATFFHYIKPNVQDIKIQEESFREEVVEIQTVGMMLSLI